MYINTHINQYVFRTKVLTKPKEIRSGMMGKRFTKEFDALLFVMNRPTSSFWMKNCIVPLDVVFVDNSNTPINKITKIYHNCPPCYNTIDLLCPRYVGDGNLVIELPGGTCKRLNIRKGHVVVFDK
jgi:uncharacterized membrane protein (UPF0127 family)